MTATPEQLASVADPSTTAQALADLAYAEPELWPAIATHPNAYPDLLDWMRANESAVATLAGDFPSTVPVEAADEDGNEQQAPDTMPEPDPVPESEPEPESMVGPPALTPVTVPKPVRPPLSPRTRKRIIITGSAIVAATTAAILLVTLVVVPQQQAAAAAQQAHNSAVRSFDAAKSECTSANGALADGIARAKTTVDTDPSTMDDPSVIDQLKTAIPTASKTAHCAAPIMAKSTEAIRRQTASLTGSIARVKRAAGDISYASDLVDASVSKKTQAAAAAAAAAQAAAAAAAAAQRTWHFQSSDGYNFDMTIAVGAPTTSGTLGQYTTPSGCTGIAAGCTTKTVAVGEGCSGFDPKTMIAVPVTVTLTARTQNFSTYVGASLQVGTSGSYQGPNDVGYDFLSSYVEEESVYSSGPDCATGNGYGGGPSFGVNFPDALVAGASASYNFDIIIEKWTSPNAPNGDTALLDWLTIQPGTTTQNSTVTYSPDSSKSITLKGDVIGG